MKEPCKHEWEEIYSQKPTCWMEGYTVYVCSVCGDEKEEFLDKIPHEIVTFPAREATCSQIGWNEHTGCANCGGEKTDYVEIPKAEHSWKLRKTVKPTCQENGFEIWQCTVCGETEERNITEKLEHTMVVVPAREATCDLVGWNEHKDCSVCHGNKIGYEEIPALGHKYDKNNICWICKRRNKIYIYKVSI